ncbi:MAG: helical backbone metal receptor [Flavobacteriales bacterium]
MRCVDDQMGRSVHVPEHPRRIISLVPSQTELLHHLGLDERVAGITKFCVHPAHWFLAKPRVGGTKKVDAEKVRTLQPDLIIGNKEENSRADIEVLEQEFPVWMSDVRDLDGALEMIGRVGELTGAIGQAHGLIEGIAKGFMGLQPPGPRQQGRIIHCAPENKTKSGSRRYGLLCFWPYLWREFSV